MSSQDRKKARRTRIRTALAAAVLLIMVLLGIILLTRSDDERFIEKQLRGVQTASEERAAFERISARKRVVFFVFDARGMLYMTEEKWWKSADLITFVCGQPKDHWWENIDWIPFNGKKTEVIDHELISPDNIEILMRE